MENPIKMDDWGVPLFFGNTHLEPKNKKQSGNSANRLTFVMTPGIQWMHHDESHESHPRRPRAEMKGHMSLGDGWSVSHLKWQAVELLIASRP